jgi:hypothetical protein
MTACNGNITSAFIDLATFDELEKYSYGGQSAITFFVRETRRSSWFTQVPIRLSKVSGGDGFGQNLDAKISRSGDYMTYNWLRCTFSSVALTQAQQALGLRLRWTRNLMHNLVTEIALAFNDLISYRTDNYHLDFWSAFTVPASKRVGYDNMIGNFAEVNNPRSLGGEGGRVLPSFTLNLPIPHCHSQDTGSALPTAALPYNEMKICMRLRGWAELLIVDNTTAGDKDGIPAGGSRPAVLTDLVAEPVLSDIQIWANYVVVSNNERRDMGSNPRDMHIQQVQTISPQTFDPKSPRHYTINLSHAITALFWGIRNCTNAAEWSNYTAASPDAFNGGQGGVNFNTGRATDPIATTSLCYENSARLSGIMSDYFSLIQPWFHADAIPEETGYHMYSYALTFNSVTSAGSTNYGKLTGVVMDVTPSPDALVCFETPTLFDAAGLAVTGLPQEYATVVAAASAGHQGPQKYAFVLTAINKNIIRISGGALGFPVL